MQYSLEKINTMQRCDALLVQAQKEKEELERKRRNLGDSINAFRVRIDRICSESLLVRSLLETFAAAYHALPESKDKARMKIKVKRLEVRQALLEEKAYTCNMRSLLAKEIKYNMLHSQMLAIDNYITVVQRRRMALGKAALRIRQIAALRAPVARQKHVNEPLLVFFSNNYPVLVSRVSFPIASIGTQISISNLNPLSLHHAHILLPIAHLVR